MERSIPARVVVNESYRKEYHRASGNSFHALLYFFSQIEMLTKIATLMILAVILVALSVSLISLAKAVEVCALSHGTDGTHEVLIPDLQASIPESVICSSAKAVEACTLSHGTFNGSHELLIPDRQPSIPSDVPTTPPSGTGDGAPLDVVDSDGEDDDPCGDGGVHQATAAGICRNDCVAELLCPAVTTLVTLLNFQPRGDSSLSDTWSPSRSTSSPPPPTSSLPPSASFPIIMVHLAILFGFTVNLTCWLMFRRGRVEIVIGFTVSLISWMMMRRGRVTAANFCRCVGFSLVAVAFFSMTYRFVPDHLAWAARAAAAVLALVFAYSLGERL